MYTETQCSIAEWFEQNIMELQSTNQFIKVLWALFWLQNNNPLYGDIHIEVSYLDLIQGNVGWLDRLIHGSEEDIQTHKDQNGTNADLGPALHQAFSPEESNDCVQYCGYIEQGGLVILSEEDQKINDSLQDAVA